MDAIKGNCITECCYNTNQNNIKYGDSDVSSKRRKLENFQGDVNKEEVYDADDSGIASYSEFKEDIDKNYLQSSFTDVATCNEYCVNDDLNDKCKLKGSLSKTKHITSAKKCTTITERPSFSSKGFENSFKLLQHQIQTKKNKECHSTISLLYPSTCELVTNDYEPTRLEIELETMRHIRTIVYKLETRRELSDIYMPLLALYYSFLSKKHKDIFYGSTAGSDEPSILIKHIQAGLDVNLKYHAGKDTDGSKCLKIVRHLLKHKVLCGSRVSQMTRTYDDIEAVTRLLEEKEKDLELTVQIGKELLTQNNILENKIADLEAELKSSNEDRSQLVHELHKKNELIAVLTNDCEDSSDNDTPTFSKSVTLDLLQKKITSLQDENKSLKNEVSQLAFQTDEIEEQERQLMSDITSQLNDTNKQFDNLSLELERQREENRLQHEQIVSLTARLSEAEMRLHQLTHDNDEHITLLNITKDNQNSLALELVEFKQRYQEVLALLQEAQEQLRKQRKKSMPQARSSYMSTIGSIQPDSLQSELMESSLYSENSLDSGISAESQRINDRIGRLMSQLPNSSNALYNNSVSQTGGLLLPPYRRVFDTVRCAAKSGSFAENDCTTSMSHLGAMSISTVSGPRMSTMTFGNDKNIGRNSLNSDHVGLGIRTLSCESLASHSDDGYPSQPCGVPGAPGAKELEAALKRLTPAEVLARRAMLSYAPAGTYTYDEHQPTAVLPMGLRTPDSILSTGSSGMSSSTNMSTSFQQWRLPEKLQIVKPIEGSQTLHHWSQLATPTLSGLLEERPGVTIRGGRGLDDLGMQIYTLSDVEEDVSEDLPGKQFEISGCTYTYTTSTVMHPDDGLSTDMSFLSQSQVSSRAASTSTSRQPSCPPTPRAGLSRKNSCSTFSVNLGLASMLNERGIKAVTPSALNTPAGPNFSPTVTPCNSPEGSPTRSMSPEPLFGILSSGADLIRRKLVGGDIERPNRNQQQKIMLTRLERRALRSLRLVEKVESIGLENIITTQPSTMSQLASGIANRSASPMSQLTSLKNIHTNSNSIVTDLHFNRSQIKDVLRKGLHSQQLNENQSPSLNVPVDFVSKMSNSNELNLKDEEHKSQHKPVAGAQIKTVSDVAATDKDISNVRVKQLQRQKSRRNIKNGQRSDLGTIGGRVRSDLGRVSLKEKEQSNLASTSSNANKTLSFDKPDNKEQQHSIAHSFVGTVSSLLFSRKGGWL